MQSKKKPKLGQNFLVDEAACRRIVDALGDLGQRTVLEIGPGHGAITGLLAARCRRLVALELDRALAAELTFRFRAHPHVTIVQGDVLQADLAGYAGPSESLDVIGNLPYYITSDILLHLFRSAPPSTLRRAVLMMQREAGDRISAQPGVREYGLLSATTQMYARAESLFVLPPQSFNPPPDVYSSVVRLDFAPRFSELQVDATGFDRFLKAAFAQKRKTLANNLRFAGVSAQALASAWPRRLAQQARAEQVPLEAMAELYRRLTQAPSAEQSASVLWG